MLRFRAASNDVPVTSSIISPASVMPYVEYEIVRPLDPWPHSEAGRFHRVLALLLVCLAGGILVVEAIRHHEPAELALLAGLLAAVGVSVAWLLRDLRRHPANFPEPTPSQGLGFAATAADASRERPRRAGAGGTRSGV